MLANPSYFERKRDCYMSLKNMIEEFKSYLGNKESLLDKNYQRTADAIKLHWGYKEFYPFINKLLIIEKGTSRQGYPLKVLEEIYKLQEIHEKSFPTLKTSEMLQHNHHGRAVRSSVF